MMNCEPVTINKNTVWMVFTGILALTFMIGCVPLVVSILTYNGVITNPLSYSSHAYIGATFLFWVGGVFFGVCILYALTIIGEGTGIVRIVYESCS